MSEAPGGLWLGRSSETAPIKPLTYIERETLKMLWKYRHRPPATAWVLGRGALMTAIFFPFMLLPGGLAAFVASIGISLVEGENSQTMQFGLATGAAVWLGLTAGLVVRDVVEVGWSVASWPMLNRILLFPEIERLLFPHQADHSVSGERT